MNSFWEDGFQEWGRIPTKSIAMPLFGNARNSNPSRRFFIAYEFLVIATANSGIVAKRGAINEITKKNPNKSRHNQSDLSSNVLFHNTCICCYILSSIYICNYFVCLLLVAVNVCCVLFRLRTLSQGSELANDGLMMVLNCVKWGRFLMRHFIPNLSKVVS